MTQKLRFGIVCRGRSLQAWQERAVTHLLETGTAELSCIFEVAPPQNQGGALWRLLTTLCRPASTREVSADRRFEKVPIVSPVDRAAAAAWDLDFIVDVVGSGEAVPESAARYGVWYFRFGEGGSLPPAFLETLRGDATIQVELVYRLGAGASLLRQAVLKVIPYHYPRTVDQAYFTAAKLPAYAASALSAGAVLQHKDVDPVAPVPPRDFPTNAAVLAFLWRWGRKVVRRIFERGVSEEWNVGIVKMQPHELLAGLELRDVRWLPPVAGGWAADPMAIKRNGEVQVLFEEMRLSSGKGRISAVSFDGSSWGPVRGVIETATHASYPFLFQHDGETYCVPETYEASEVALYRAKEFPAQWERVATLIDGIPAIDPTLFEHDGLFWMLFTTSENSNAMLFAHWAEHLGSPWRPHACNPIKIDVRSSRPAGPPFRVDGQLYRPAQDSSVTYGGRVSIQRLVALSPTEFREETACWVNPPMRSRFSLGLHTLCFAGEYCVIDGKRFVRRS